MTPTMPNKPVKRQYTDRCRATCRESSGSCCNDVIDATLVTRLQAPIQKVRDLTKSAMLVYYSALCAFDLGMILSGLWPEWRRVS